MLRCVGENGIAAPSNRAAYFGSPAHPAPWYGYSEILEFDQLDRLRSLWACFYEPSDKPLYAIVREKTPDKAWNQSLT